MQIQTNRYSDVNRDQVQFVFPVRDVGQPDVWYLVTFANQRRKAIR